MVSVVIPTYHERANIETLLARLFAVREALDESMEIVIVDDGSSDGTATYASDFLQRHAFGVVYERRSGARGLASALYEGVQRCRGELIAVMDADLSHPPELLPALVRAVHEGHEVAIASRYVAGGTVRRWSAGRYLLSRCGNALARPLAGVADATSGYFVCRADVVRPLALELQGFKMLLEILVKGCLHHVCEVPYEFTDRVRGSSKLGPAVMRDYLSQLIRLYGYRRRHPCTHHLSGAASQFAQTGRQRLSVVILTKNEERNIGRCLESVRWADEIVVVDGMSTDKTVELCEQVGARVIRHAFEGSFAQERNLGIERATGDWVLQIDADDVVTPEFRAAVERVLADSQPYQAFKFRRKSYLMGRCMRYGGWYHYLPNLIRRKSVRYIGDVHERPVVQGEIGVLEADIEHHPCEDLAAFITRHNRYTSIQAGELVKTGAAADTVVRLERHLIRTPWKTFWKSYVKKQGWREGMHGLLFGLLFAWIELLKWAKCWERSVHFSTPVGSGLWVQSSGSFVAGAHSPQPTAQSVKRRSTVSVVLMTKNEEAQLAACLDGVAGWADEIVVIDDLSTDKTVEIARRYTEKIFSDSCEDNHDRQWNRGIEHASSEWILHIDADERVTPALKAAIDRALADDHGHSAFEIMRKNFFLGHPMRYGGWYHRHLVLFRRHRARCVGAGIHVRLKVDGTIGFLNAEIEHYPFSSIAQFIERQNRYTTVGARMLLKEQGVLPARAVAYQLIWRPVKLFWKAYVKNQGRREGRYGLVFGLLYSFVHFMLWAKYWELVLRRREGACQATP